MDKDKQSKSENLLKKPLEEQGSERNKRLDKIVEMQQDLGLKRIKYNLFFAVISLIVTLFMMLIGMPLWVGVLFFIGIFFALRYFYLEKLLINRYNKHANGLYGGKE